AIGLADENDFPHPGTLMYFDNELNPAKGTIAAHGTVPNPSGLLFPGMFARLRMSFGRQQKALEFPDAAVRDDWGKHLVVVVNDHKILERREVSVGKSDGGMRIIEKGLGADEWVVAGESKGLRPGDAVKPQRTETEKDKR